MARKVTQDAVNAFIAGRTGSFGGNTTVELSPLGEVIVLKLHGNAIARRDKGPTGTFEVCDGGWSSNTTKERLNGLPGVRVNQRTTHGSSMANRGMATGPPSMGDHSLKGAR